MGMSQCQILQLRSGYLGLRNGIIGRIGLQRIAVENADLICFRSLRMEMLQQRITIHSGKTRTVNTAIQLRQHHAFHRRLGKNVDILRPQFLLPRTGGRTKIVIARSDKHRDLNLFQRLFQLQQGLSSRHAIKDIAG